METLPFRQTMRRRISYRDCHAEIGAGYSGFLAQNAAMGCAEFVLSRL
jgi:hypothetical protein